MNIYAEIQKLAGWIRTDVNNEFITHIIKDIKSVDYEETLALFETRSSVPVRHYIENN